MNAESTVCPDGVPVFSQLLNECALRKIRIAGHAVLHNFFNSGTVSLAKSQESKSGNWTPNQPKKGNAPQMSMCSRV